MKTLLLFIVLLPGILSGQITHGNIDLNPKTKLNINKINERLNETQFDSPEEGEIKWNGSDIVGWNGLAWVSLTNDKIVNSVKDIDGNKYKTIQIGDQIWMAENLKVTRFNDGQSIQQIETADAWAEVNNAWCWFDNNGFYDEYYGKLYSRGVIENDVCPVGWRVPGFNDWYKLSIELGKNGGDKLKESGIFWKDNFNKSSCFNARPSGYRLGNGSFLGNGQIAMYWSTYLVVLQGSEEEPVVPEVRIGELTPLEQILNRGGGYSFFIISSDSELTFEIINNPKQGFPIRCIKE